MLYPAAQSKHRWQTLKQTAHGVRLEFSVFQICVTFHRCVHRDGNTRSLQSAGGVRLTCGLTPPTVGLISMHICSHLDKRLQMH